VQLETKLFFSSIELLPPGYEIIHSDRSGRGGGVALVYRKGLKITCTQFSDLPETNSFEELQFNLNTNDLGCIKLWVLYRPQPSAKNKLSSSQFFEDFDGCK